MDLNPLLFKEPRFVICSKNIWFIRLLSSSQLIFSNEYTQAENQNWHLKHFCCFDCDNILAGEIYVMVSDKPVCKPCYVKNHAVVRSVLRILLYHLALCLYLSLLEVRNRKYYFQIGNVIPASGIKIQIMQKQYMCSLWATLRFLSVHPKCYLIIKCPF